MMLPQRKTLYTRLLLRAAFGVAGLLLLLYAVPPLLSVLTPFIIAYMVAVLLNPLVSILRKKLGLPRKVTALILVILVLLILASLIGWCIYTVVNEALAVARNFQSIWDSISTTFILINEQLEWLIDFLPSDTEETLANITNGLYQWLQSSSGDFVNSIVSGTASVTTKIGGVFLQVIILLLASYFITSEYPAISGSPQKYLGIRAQRYIRIMKDAIKSALGGYFKAQLLLALLAFVVMLLALLIYGQGYAFLLALLLAFIDFLPILGTSALLIPWGLIELAAGDVVKCIFLWGLAGGFFLVRRMVEPHIVGSQTGFHPLAALVSIVIGMRVSGVWGAVFGPIVAMIAFNTIKSGIFDNAVKDFRDACDDIATVLHRDG
jgi:sporulation integral membrane protein YtvI